MEKLTETRKPQPQALLQKLRSLIPRLGSEYYPVEAVVRDYGYKPAGLTVLATRVDDEEVSIIFELKFKRI